MSQQATAAPGWHPDPIGAASWRYWDGRAWTAQTGPASRELGLTPLREVVGQELLLHQQIGTGDDELKAGETRVGVLHKPFAGEVTAHTADGSWHFDREGVTQNRVGVKVVPAGAEIAKFAWEGVATGTRGDLSFPDGRVFRLERTTDIGTAHTGFVRVDNLYMAAGEWAFVSAEGTPLVSSGLFTRAPQKKTKKVFGKEIEYTTSKREYGTGRTAAQVRTALHPEAGPVVELPLLALLATYCTWWTATIHESVSRDRGVF
jgi:hypothetical protein